MRRRALLATAALTLAGCTSDGGDRETPEDEDTPTSTAEPTTTEPQSDEEIALQAARSGAEGQFTERIQSVEAAPDFQGRDGYMAEVRLDLQSGIITGADRAEHMGGTVARETIKSVATSEAENVTAVAIYAYVPTTDGESVSTKVVVDLEQYQDVDWSAQPWQRIRDEADQYQFNGYLYD